MNELLWSPGPERVAAANMTRFMQFVQSELDSGVSDYQGLYEYSNREPAKFWRVVWDFCSVIGDPGERALVDGDQMPGAQFFPDARLNFAENLLRRRDDGAAMLFRSETGIQREISYAQLHADVSRTAKAMRVFGIVPGDRVAAFMPNIPETITAMLAAASIGAIWSSCSPDFGTAGVVDRLGQVAPRILFCTATYVYNGKIHDCLGRVREIIGEIPSIERVVVVPFLEEVVDTGDIDIAVSWGSFCAAEAADIDFEQLPFNHPLYILFSSGTTGVPKCITHGAGGTLLQHQKEHVLHVDLKSDDRIYYFTTCGWMMWNWLASALATGAAIVLYEGAPFHPSPEVIWDMAEDFGVTVFGAGAKLYSAWENAGVKPGESHDLSALQTCLSTGSVLAPESYDYIYRDIKSDICLSSVSGGTDIVSCFVGGNPALPVYRGELQCLALGMDIEIRRADGSEAELGETGELCCVQPFPSMPVCFWGDEDGSRYHAAYFEQFPGVWAHGDFAAITEHGGMVIYGRSDATLNPGGVRIGTAEIYRQVEKLDEVLEAICVGQDWDDDVRVVLFLRLREGLVLDEDLQDLLRNTIRTNTTPRHVPARIIQVADIPRTVSGKITELAVRDVIHGREVINVDALANPEALELYQDLPELRS